MDCKWSVHSGQLLDRFWIASGSPLGDLYKVWELGGCLDIWRAWGTRPGRPDGAQTPCIFLDAHRHKNLNLYDGGQYRKRVMRPCFHGGANAIPLAHTL
jgi:hypothetical protein